MNVADRNKLLLQGYIAEKGLFPTLEQLAGGIVFEWDFGLRELPEEPGVLVIRGPRQYGKTAWLEQQLKGSIERFGAGSALYLNGDYLSSVDELEKEIADLLPLFSPTAEVKRLFVDEMSAVDDWSLAVKRLADAGALKDVLLVTTGSRASDLLRGAELLPGRRGKLARTDYLFTPISFPEFYRKAQASLGQSCLSAYLISGGSPLAAKCLIEENRIPTYVFEITRQWIFGECARGKRSRASLLRLCEQLMRHACSPVPQTVLARESGMANNSVAEGYLGLLGDLLVLGTTEPWNVEKNIRITRKAAKYPFVNLLAANTLSETAFTDTTALDNASAAIRSAWYEWAVAAEIFRRKAIAGELLPLLTAFWQSKKHEIDYVLSPDSFIEVKMGAANALDFAWFPKTFPHATLKVITNTPFSSANMQGVSLENFLLEEAPDPTATKGLSPPTKSALFQR